MEDDWTAGHSGYSFDIPMFLTSPAPEAASDWQVARSKKPARPATTARMVTPRCGATSTGTRPTCPCHVRKGRYGALSDIGPDLDFDIPMMMMSQVEGDVPPTDAGGGAITRPPSKTEPRLNKEKMAEAKKTLEQHSLKYRDSLNKRVARTFTKVFPLNPGAQPASVPVKPSSGEVLSLGLSWMQRK